MQDIYRFADSHFGAPRFGKERRQLKALGRKFFEEGRVPEEIDGGARPEEIVLHHRDYTFYPERLEVDIDGQRKALSLTENQILWCLAARPNRIVKTEELGRKLWGFTTDATDLVRPHIFHIRRKFAHSDGSRIEVIKNVVNVGYMLVDEDSPLDQQGIVFVEMSEEVEEQYIHSAYIHYPERFLIVKDGQEIHLTPVENELLTVLERNRNMVVSYDVISDNLHNFLIEDEDDVEDNRNPFKTHVSHLRKKIEPEVTGGRYRYLVNAKTIGYGLRDPSKLPHRQSDSDEPSL